MKRLYYLDKLGWPVELVEGRWFLNFLRRVVHTRKVTFKRPSCLEVPPPGAFEIQNTERNRIGLVGLIESESNVVTLETIEKVERGEAESKSAGVV